jgi:type I restriction enzyme S subunit
MAMNKKWPIVPLKKVLKPVSRPEPVDPEKTYHILGAHWYAQGLYTKYIIKGAQIQAKKLYKIEKGDFVYNRLFAWKGSFSVAVDENDGCYVSIEFPSFAIDNDIFYSKYLWKLFSLDSIWDEALGLSTGGTPTSRNRLKEEKLLAMNIPLPPLEEQRRIVARIEELVARIEEAQELRRRGVEEMDALKSSAKSVFFSKEFNKQWPIMALSDIADIRAGATLGRSLCGPTIKLPYLRVANVQDGYLDLGSIKEIEILESEQEKWQLQDGDILLTEGGDWDKLGRGVVWHSEIKMCIHQNHIFRLRVNPNEFDPEYLCSLIGSAYGKDYFRAASKQTTNLASINQRQLKAFKAFKPPLEEQRRIIAYVDALQSNLDALKRHQAETANKLDALMPSILNKAFSGEL